MHQRTFLLLPQALSQSALKRSGTTVPTQGAATLMMSSKYSSTLRALRCRDQARTAPPTPTARPGLKSSSMRFFFPLFFPFRSPIPFFELFPSCAHCDVFPRGVPCAGTCCENPKEKVLPPLPQQLLAMLS